jgi:hypothetical protein
MSMRSHIKEFSRLGSSKIDVGLVCWLTIFGLSSPPPAKAGLLVVNGVPSQSNGFLSVSTRAVDGPSAQPFITSDSPNIMALPQQLLSAGSNYPVVSSTPTNASNVSTAGPSSIAATPLRISSSFPGFGNGRTLVIASATPIVGIPGTFGPIRGGTFFTPAFAQSVNNLTAVTATVNASTSDLKLVNTGPGSISGRPGTALSVVGSVDPTQGGFVEAALTGTFDYTHLGKTISGSFNPIIFAFNGRGALPNFAEVTTPDGMRIINRTSLPSGFSFTASKATNLSSYNLGSITLDPTSASNDSFHIRSTLTLIADPGTISVADLPLTPDMPDIGVFATTNVIPEPASIILLSLGIAAVGLGIGWRHVSGRRPRTKMADGLSG